MAEPKEPQSYGSEGDWQSGDVGEQVNRLKGNPNSQVPVQKVTDRPTGAKTDSYFKKRDWD